MFRNIFNGFRNIDFNNFYILSGVTLSFGNIYYFKPAFLLNKKNQLIKHSLKIKDISLKTNFFKIHEKIKKNDFFYKEKFSKYMWSRPYLFSMLKNFKRKFVIILFFSLKYIEIKKKII